MRSELIKEEWRPVRGYECLYDASNFGRVRSLDHWRDNGTGGYIQKGSILKPAKKENGYLKVGLYKDGKVKQYYLHRLVYEAFNGLIPDGIQVNHINEIKSDNSLWNLNLMTPKENLNYGKRNEKYSDPVLQLTLDDILVKEWPSAAEAARNGYDRQNISACCLGKRKTHKGFKWVKKC